jgi:hypothetical protein
MVVSGYEPYSAAAAGACHAARTQEKARARSTQACDQECAGPHSAPSRSQEKVLGRPGSEGAPRGSSASGWRGRRAAARRRVPSGRSAASGSHSPSPRARFAPVRATEERARALDSVGREAGAACSSAARTVTHCPAGAVLCGRAAMAGAHSRRRIACALRRLRLELCAHGMRGVF